MFNLKNIIYKFERLMTAVTFSEAGETNTARGIMKEKSANRRKRAGMKVKKHIDRRPVLRV